MKNIIEAKGIIRTFINGEIETPVLKGIDLEVKEGEFLAIMGRSGAGKSTLMYQLSLLDDPNGGKINIDGTDILSLSNNQKTLFRLNHLGYVFQDYALVPELTAIENVSLPLLMKDVSMEEAFKKAEEKLKDLGLEDRQINNLPSQLSGGEQQRVSLARAIVDEPKIVFSDEPTANLDAVSARMVIDILKRLNKKGLTMVMVTHEEEYGREADRIVRLKDGKIEKIDVMNHKN